MKEKRDTLTSQRKADHLKINLEKDVQSGISNGLESFHFLHQALPEINLDDVNLTCEIFGKRLNAPILISSMTGGTGAAGNFNQLWASAAQEFGIAMGVGSQRAALEDPSYMTSFQVRKAAPDILLFANLGAVQLNYGYGIDACKRAVDMIEADALFLHLNPLQEALQPDGDTQFGGLLKKIEAVCKALPVPVIVKEVGWGISGNTAKKLAEAGISGIDTSGAGGTSWSQVEKYRSASALKRSIAADFRDWGIPTAKTIQMVRQSAPNMLIFASGGLTNGIEVAKCLALGARLGGMAGPFLRAANQGQDNLFDFVRKTIEEIRLCLFLTGKSNLESFDQSVLYEEGTAIK